MSRIFAIRGTEGAREVDYFTFTVKGMHKRIKDYELKFGSFVKFLRRYDCESSATDDSLTLIDWECLLNELKGRRGTGLSLAKSAKRKPH